MQILRSLTSLSSDQMFLLLQFHLDFDEEIGPFTINNDQPVV